MAIGRHGAKNAGVLAAQILALKDDAIRDRLVEFKNELDPVPLTVTKTFTGREYYTTVDRAEPGWEGPVGLVTRLVDRAPFDPDDATIMTCGPETTHWLSAVSPWA